MKWEVNRLRQIHHEILRRLTLGQKPSDIAKAMDVTPQTVRNIAETQLGSEELAILGAMRDADAVDMAETIRKEAEASFLFMATVRAGDVEGVTLEQRIKAADSIMDRAQETSKVRRSESRILSAVYTAEELEQLKENARVAAAQGQMLVEDISDAEVVEVNEGAS